MTFQSEFEIKARSSAEAGAAELPGWDIWVNPTTDRAANAESLATLRRRLHAAAIEKSRAFETAASTILAAALWLPAAAEIARQADGQDDGRLAVAPHAAQNAAAAVLPSDSALDPAPRWPDWIADLGKAEGFTAG